MSYTREQLMSWISLAQAGIDTSVLEDNEVQETMDRCLGHREGTLSRDDVDSVLEECLSAVESHYKGDSDQEFVRDRMNVVAAIFGHLRDNAGLEDRILTADALYDAFVANWSEPGSDNTYIVEGLAPGDEFEAVAQRWLAEAEEA